MRFFLLLVAVQGSNVEVVRYKNIQMEIWDLGGQQSLRPFWATYYRQVRLRGCKQDLSSCSLGMHVEGCRA